MYKFIFTVFILFGFMIDGIAHSEDISIKTIKPVPSIDVLKIPENKNIQIEGIKTGGIIEAIDDDRIGIADRWIYFGQNIKFFFKTGEKAKKIDFKIGNTVLCVLNGQGQMLSMWKIK